MGNVAATREALDRFIAETPGGSVAADRLSRIAHATRALYDQALSAREADTAWADHNLAIIISEGLDDNGVRAAATSLFLGVRRRLAAALEHDPDDLTPALALALGAAHNVDDPQETVHTVHVAPLGSGSNPLITMYSESAPDTPLSFDSS